MSNPSGGNIIELFEIILIAAVVLLALGLFLWAFISSLIIIQEYETGVYMRLGKFVKNFQPGLHFVIPFISRVYRVDTRVLTIDLGRKEMMTNDLSPTVIEAIIQYRVESPEKSMFKYEKYKNTLSQLSHTTMRKLALTYDLEDLIRDQIKVNERFRAELEKEFNLMGIVLHRTEIKEIDPVGPVKAAIEDRIAAEKERQAMILRADGKKKALIMEAEGRKHLEIR